MRLEASVMRFPAQLCFFLPMHRADNSKRAENPEGRDGSVFSRGRECFDA